MKTTFSKATGGGSRNFEPLSGRHLSLHSILHTLTTHQCKTLSHVTLNMHQLLYTPIKLRHVRVAPEGKKTRRVSFNSTPPVVFPVVTECSRVLFEGQRKEIERNEHYEENRMGTQNVWKEERQNFTRKLIEKLRK
ncbi:hypothetical protein TNCV_3840771 [Trichonephila clavipes]|nr:hypothetical protein TNCV_3840771 [Trichonephila clavipes]